MFVLNLLGGVSIQGPNGPLTGKAAHKRRVALLAILASARGRTVGRERLIGLLWPEHGTDAARHLLSESLYVLRKALGEHAFVTVGDEVGLNGEVVGSDVAEFARRVDAGELEAAAAVYRGPFLDGLFVADAPEFERWSAGERARLAAAHTRALECLADAAEGRGRPEEAAEWWRRLTVLDPYNSRVGMRLMLALDAAGERAAALWFAETHAALLRDELGVETDDDFDELVRRLRRQPVRVPTPPHAALPPVAPPSPPSAIPPAPAPAPTLAPEIRDRVDQVETDDSEEHGGEDDRVVDGGEADGGSAAGDRIEEIREDPPLEIRESAPVHEVAPPVDGSAADAGADARGVAAFRRHATISLTTPSSRSAESADAIPDRDLPALPAAVATAIRVRRRPGWRVVAAAAVLVLLLVAAFLPRGEEPVPPAPAGYDPQRVAVLYFDDHSRGGELGYLATGLTESLINALAQVPALQVISRNGVKRYRDAPARFDSMAADLRAGSLVEGSVQRSGDSVRVTVQLIDANTHAHVESATLVHPVTDVFVMEDALADSVARLLRRRLGRQVALRRTRAETASAEAWRLVMEAEKARDEAARLLRSGDPVNASSAARQLGRADSLLAAAEAADPGWTRPTVARGWVARARGAARAGGDGEARALAFAERALRRRPDDAAARELRGTALLAQAAAGAGAAADPRLERAEADLRAAVEAEPGLASAWNRLSQVLAFRGRFAESERAARRALAEDAYLEGADVVLKNLFLGALYTRDYAGARALCDQGRERFPGDWRFVECRLTLLRADGTSPADPALAARVLAQLDTLDPPERARRDGRAYSPLFRRAVAAAVLARAGRGDEARAMLAQARRAAGDDPALRRSLAYDEAHVHLLLGQRDSARALLEWAVARNPGVRAFAARDPLFRDLLAPAGAATDTPTAASP